MIKKLSNLRRRSRNSSRSSFESDAESNDDVYSQKSWRGKSDYSLSIEGSDDDNEKSGYKGKVLKVFRRRNKKKKKKKKNIRSSLTASESEFVSDDGSSYYTSSGYNTSSSFSGADSEIDEEVKTEPHRDTRIFDELTQPPLNSDEKEDEENSLPRPPSQKIFQAENDFSVIEPCKKSYGKLKFQGGRKDGRAFVQVAQQYVPQINLDNVYLLPVSVLKKLKQLPKFELCKKALKTAREVMYDHESRVLFVSHRWQTTKHPDEYNLHYDTILRFLAGHEDLGISHVWIDFSCLPQRQTHANILLRKNVSTALFVADAFLVIPRFHEITTNPHTDLCGYCRRAWCQLELIIARLRKAPIYLFSFREHVVDFRLWPPAQSFRAIADQMASDYQQLASIEVVVDAAAYDLPDISLDAASKDLDEVLYEGTNNWQKQSLSTLSVRASTCQQFRCWEPLSDTSRKQDKWLVVNLLAFVLLYADEKLMSAHCQADFQGMVQQRCHPDTEELPTDTPDSSPSEKKGATMSGGKRLELVNMELVPYDLERLLEAALKLHLHPSTLVVSGNLCSGIGFDKFLARRCDTLERIVMEGEAVSDLSFLTKHNFAKLDSVNFRSNNIDAQGCRQLKLFLKEHPGLTTLVLSDNKIGNSALIELVEGLTDHPSLKTLDVSKNMIASRGAKSLLALARDSTCLQKIDFSCNLVTPDECQSLAEEWQKTRTDCLLVLDVEMIRSSNNPKPKREMCVPLNCFNSR